MLAGDAASAGTSATSMCGLDSDSTKRTLVVGRIAAWTAARSVTSTWVTSMPLEVRDVVEQHPRDHEQVGRGDEVVAGVEQRQQRRRHGRHAGLRHGRRPRRLRGRRVCARAPPWSGCRSACRRTRRAPTRASGRRLLPCRRAAVEGERGRLVQRRVQCVGRRVDVLSGVDRGRRRAELVRGGGHGLLGNGSVAEGGNAVGHVTRDRKRAARSVRGDDSTSPGWTALDDLAVDHHRQRVADLARERHLVRHDDHRHAGRGERSHHVEHLADELGIEGAGRLVEQEHLRTHRQRASDRHALLLTARQLARVGVGLVGEPDLIEQVASLRARPRRDAA